MGFAPGHYAWLIYGASSVTWKFGTALRKPPRCSLLGQESKIGFGTVTTKGIDPALRTVP